MSNRSREPFKDASYKTWSFPHSRLITGFVTRLIRRVPLVELELLTLPEHLSSPPVCSGIRLTRSLVVCAYFIDRCFVLLYFFFWVLCCLFFSFDIRIFTSSPTYVFVSIPYDQWAHLQLTLHITRNISFLCVIRRVWRYQRGNQNPYIEGEEQTTQNPKEKVQKDKTTIYKTTFIHVYNIDINLSYATIPLLRCKITLTNMTRRSEIVN
jgi:hypothetical protein